MTSARIAIADDHELVRRGLRMAVSEHSGWVVCGEAKTGSEAVELARQARPDVMILDYSMPEMNGIEAARQIRVDAPETEVLMLTVHESDSVVRDALSAGVHGFILKSDAGHMLTEAIESLLKKKPYFTGRISQMLLQRYLSPGNAGGSVGGGNGEERLTGRLTNREREVLQLIAEGWSTKGAADRLGISPKTAETHRSNIMRKLNLHSVSELVRFAIRHKLVEP